jgi:hypothetical protein
VGLTEKGLAIGVRRYLLDRLWTSIGGRRGFGRWRQGRRLRRPGTINRSSRRNDSGCQQRRGESSPESSSKFLSSTTRSVAVVAAAPPLESALLHVAAAQPSDHLAEVAAHLGSTHNEASMVDKATRGEGSKKQIPCRSRCAPYWQTRSNLPKELSSEADVHAVQRPPALGML